MQQLVPAWLSCSKLVYTRAHPFPCTTLGAASRHRHLRRRGSLAAWVHLQRQMYMLQCKQATLCQQRSCNLEGNH